MACLRIVISRKSPSIWARRSSSPRIWGISARDSGNHYLPPESGVTHAQVADVLQKAYGDKPLVRLYDKGVPALKNVVGLPFCDIGFAVGANI